MKERISYYDFARGLGIIFVVIGHIDTFYMPFRSVVITFHMALFLLISGMLFLETEEEKRPYLQLLKKKFQRIMVPYILFSLISVVIEFIRLTMKDIFFWPHYKVLLTAFLTGYGNSSLWFLPALFISEMLFLGIRKAGRDWVSVLAAAVLAGSAVWVNTVCNSEIFWIENLEGTLTRAVFCTLFLCVGYYVRKWIISRKIPGVVYTMAGLIFIGICIIMNQINPKVDLRTMNWGEYYFMTTSTFALTSVRVLMYLTAALTGAWAVIFFSMRLERLSDRKIYKFLTFFGRNSLIIMATHLDCHVLHYSMDLAGIINSLIPNPILYHTFLLIFVFAAESLLIFFINRYLPILTGRIRFQKNS